MDPLPRTPGHEDAAPDPARRRLLDAAAACFARRGYAGTTVRDITTRARCNVGAVTYHFGGKHKVYVAVFEERLSELTRRRVGALGSLGPAPALEQVIRTFAVAFLDPLQGSARGRETMMLLLRELVDGQLPASLVTERMVRPSLGALTQALERACPGLAREGLALCAQSLVSQLVHVLHLQRLHERGRASSVPPIDLERTLGHIVRFSAAGVRACREQSR
jgi:AcrR family transcriptional regulator